jgi:Tfp pilus assembly protein PilO
MSEIFDQLRDKERTTLERLTASVLVVLALGFVLTIWQRSKYFDAKDSLAVLQDRARRAEKDRTDAKVEWLRWQEAVKDIESFHGTLFYDEKTVFRTIRLDLQQIFSQAGMDIPQINYRYLDLEKVPIKKIVLSFNYSGTYAELKRFLAIVERFHKFLAVEKIDFQKADAESGVLNLKLTLAGYYEI